MQYLGYLLVAIVVVVGGYWLYTNNTAAPTGVPTENSMQIQGQDVSYFAGANGYFVRPAATGTYPGVVLIHENRGLRPEIRTAAEDLAKEGYMVLAVDLLGPPVETQDEARALTTNYNQATGTANMRAAAAYLRQEGATKIGSWGWCFGGAQSLQLALSGEPLAATVIYYGSRPITDAEQLKVIKWPVLGVYGDQDQAIPTTTVDAFKKALTDARVNHEVHMYSGVGHAFANPSNPNHHPQHTADAWAKTVAFLNEHLK